MNKKRFFLIFLSSLFLLEFIFPQKVNYPQIKNLNSKDNLFKEYSYIVAQNYKLIANLKNPELIFFTYKVADSKLTLLELAARCNIPYDTIATINELEFSTEKLFGKTLILPTAPGLFIKRDKTDNSLEILLQEKYFNSENDRDTIDCKIEDKNFIFIINQRFSPTQRAYFLDSGLRLPLNKDSYWVSSSFGKRKNPFSGEWKDHNGIDLAADEGTPVYAIKDGYVANVIKDDSVFGNYIILTHDKGSMTSVYAHLSKFIVEQYEYIQKGDIIGYVGQTGMATGPHLHFEIRQGGRPLDPETKLKLQK